MKLKLKNLFKRKNHRFTFEEAQAYFTAMTNEQKAAKKAGNVRDRLLGNFPTMASIGMQNPWQNLPTNGL